MSLDEILRLIRGAGKLPVERDSFYNVVREYGDGSGDAPGTAPRGAAAAA
jgi:aminodeoxyfutalosine synthase